MFKALLAGTMVMSLGVVAAHADTLNISFGQPNYDNMVRDAKLRGDGGLEDWNLGAGSGGSNRFYANFLLNGSPSGRLNTFVQWFDVSSIPAGSIINSATLTTHMANQSANTRTWVDVNLSRLQSGNNWVEFVLGGSGPHTDGSVTWNNRITHPTTPTPWAIPGALGGADIDLGTTQVFDIVGVDGSATTVVRDITAWVQAWVDSPSSNAGMLWHGGKNDDSNSQNRYFHFGTKEDGAGPPTDANAAAPSLVIDYTPGGSPVAPIIAEVTPDPDSVFEGQQYVKQLTLTQGTFPITWSVLPGSPPGTVVSGSGQVSGWTPGPADIGSTFTINIQAMNAQGSDTESWQVAVQGMPPVIAEVTPDPEAAMVGPEYTKQLVLTQGTLPVTWSVLAGSPPGAVVSSTGLVSGWTPSASDVGQTFTFDIQAQNPYGSDTESWEVKVLATNNGFFPDYVYVIRDTGEVRAFGEADGLQKQQLATDMGGGSLTFAGEGRNDDARLFVARPSAGDTDVEIFEISSSGTVLNSNTLSSIVGAPVGTAIILGNIRYSLFHDTLFVGLNPNHTASTPDVCYEIDLALASRVHTYIGPSSFGQPDPGLEQGRNANVAVNERDGTLYLIGRHLGEPTGSGQGDLVAFNTAGRPVGGTTSTFTTLIDGPSYSAGDSRYSQPHSVIYRQSLAGAVDDTVLILMNPSAGAASELEFWLDTTAHPSGNVNFLALRESPISAPRGWNGQQDDTTGDLWFAALRGGIHSLRIDNSTFSFENGANWVDADSPPFQVCNEPFADADGDGDVDLDDFGQFQRCFTGQFGAPPAGCACFDRQQDGDVDNFDFNAFSDCTTGSNVPWEPGLTPNCSP